MLQAKLLTFSSAVLLSVEEARTEERMTENAEMEVGSSNNFPLCFIITTTISSVPLIEGSEGQWDSEQTYQSLM